MPSWCKTPKERCVFTFEYLSGPAGKTAGTAEPREGPITVWIPRKDFLEELCPRPKEEGLTDPLQGLLTSGACDGAGSPGQDAKVVDIMKKALGCI